jgi:hypothetical protein
MGRRPLGPAFEFQYADDAQRQAVLAVAAEETERRGKRVAEADVVREFIAYGLTVRTSPSDEAPSS